MIKIKNLVSEDIKEEGKTYFDFECIVDIDGKEFKCYNEEHIIYNEEYTKDEILKEIIYIIKEVFKTSLDDILENYNKKEDICIFDYINDKEIEIFSGNGSGEIYIKDWFISIMIEKRGEE